MMEISVPVAHAPMVAPVLMNLTVSDVFVWVEQGVIDVNVSNQPNF